MNKHVIFYTTLFALLLFGMSATAQRSSTELDYYNSGWWTLGITGGASWQGSDICAMPGWGLGVDLAKNIYHRPNGLLDVDLRGRALYTRSFGADPYRTYGILNNNALNGVEDADVNYTAPNGPGFTFLNHRTDIGELSLEGVLTANRLRENTGIILQGFGGIGLNGYSTSTDQLGGNSMYNWSEIDTTGGRFSTIADLNRDHSYETFADGYDNGFNVSVMPSLGLGLGYQVTPAFSVGVEHKTTWAMNDHLDGQRFNQYDNNLSDNNDRYNYTSLYLRWKIRGRYDKEPIPVTERPDELKDMGIAPIITFTKPRKEVSTASDPRVSVTANIENIEGRQDIQATFNGKRIGTFNFNQRKDKFSTLLNLVSGSNELVITATNKYGTVTDSRVIFLEESIADPVTYTPPVSNPDRGTNTMKKYPEVRITRPSADPYRSNEQVVKLTANLENVSGKNDITFKINGAKTTNFEFGYLDNTIVADVPLNAETTTVTIKVRNSYGTDTDSRKIIYTGYRDLGPKPVVDIITPSGSSANSEEDRVALTAKVRHVDSKNDIIYTVNGQRKTSFSYNRNTNVFTSNVSLNGERTQVVIEASNDYGSDADDLTIVYCPPAYTPQRPTVKINKPMSNPYNTRNASERVTATVTNVNDKDDIRIKINNKNISNFNFNNSANEISFTTNLESGNNTVIIKATNSAGSDSDDLTIRYNAAEKPTVKINTPSFDPYSTSNDKTNIVATINHVDSKSNITFKLNGRKTNNFSYNTYTGKLTANVNLESGSNTVLIKATNETGSDSDDTEIKYKKGRDVVDSKPVTFVKTPIVKITTPNSDPYTADRSSTGIVATVKHVPSRDDITVKVNGKTVNNFQYIPQINRVTVDVSLENGNNTVIVTGRSGSKSANDKVTITYRRGSSTGQFGDTYSDDDDEEEGEGSGSTSSRDTRSANNKTVGNRSLGDGKATTSDKRSSSKGTRKTTSKPAPVTNKPKITVQQPTGLKSKATKASTLDIVAQLENTKKDNIELFVNGKLTDEFTYTKGGILKATVNLKKGGNTIKIKATNKSGKTEKTINLLRR